MSLTEEVLHSIHDEVFRQNDWGRPAQYIPELAAIAPDQFAMSVCLADGRCLNTGTADKPFSIQSVSKVFSLAATLGRIGDQLWIRVGREPSGTSFDSGSTPAQCRIGR